ncbi:LmeA family phospholipid-binding protein [Parenemella sanctibonifatiensis]|uniref:DUF2993 domain-containing protein n=1 Tax=Parenemella sanctibonifatiensis TaxID=2016505 RepID=A0A255EIQ4_9ACTN|nr:DUF2993 domain-containing protein [Parenemella sanctibonifatiensis]OYN91396.1 hypothetical protein CGZ91_08195 [Parenemella sanctibonifatiensis]
MAERARSGRGWRWALTALVLVLAAVVALVETVGRDITADIFANEVQSAIGAAEPPAVEIPEGSMTLQLLTRELDRLEIDAESLTLSLQGSPVQLGVSSVDATGVDFADRDNVRIAHFDGTTVLPYATLSELSGLEIRPDDGGRVRVVHEMSVFGTPIEAQVEGRLGLNEADQTIRLLDPQITVAQVQLSPEQSAELVDHVTEPFPLGLPAGLRATSLTAGDAGFEVKVTGTDVNLSELN